MAFLLRRRRLLLPLRQAQSSRPLSSSPVIDFLIDSCDLSSSSAATVAASPRLPSLSKPNTLSKAHSVLSLLRSHHFSPSNIASIVSTDPSLLAIHPDVLTFELRLLSAAAGVASKLPDLVNPNPSVLKYSLDNHLVPVLDLLQTYLSSPNQLLIAVRRGRDLLTCDFRKTLQPNITLLLDTGAPISNISKLLTTYPYVLTQNPDRFADAVSVVQRFGLNPARLLFNHGVYAVSARTVEARDRRLERLKKWGWSEDDISTAFCKAPLFLMVSDEQMERTVDYLVNTVGFRHANIISRPTLLIHSLKKCIMPRFAVISVLQKNGLSAGKAVSSKFTISKSDFFRRFVKRYSERLPELENVYRGENEDEELNSDCGENEVEELNSENIEGRFKPNLNFQKMSCCQLSQ